MVLFLVCTMPFLTSNIIRMISWIPFLGRNGLLNTDAAQARADPLTRWNSCCSPTSPWCWPIVHLYTLFMVTPIFNTMMRIDRRADRGGARRRRARAGRWSQRHHSAVQAGIAIGSIFVVTLVMGDFITVRLMSGGQSASVGLMIANQISLLQYPAAARERGGAAGGRAADDRRDPARRRHPEGAVSDGRMPHVASRFCAADRVLRVCSCCSSTARRSTILVLSFQGPDGGLTFPMNGVSLHWFARLFETQAVGDFGGSLARSFAARR